MLTWDLHAEFRETRPFICGTYSDGLDERREHAAIHVLFRYSTCTLGPALDHIRSHDLLKHVAVLHIYKH